jgi:hypothetical protein
MSDSDHVTTLRPEDVEAEVRNALREASVAATIVSVTSIDAGTPTWDIWLLRGGVSLHIEIESPFYESIADWRDRLRTHVVGLAEKA